MTHGSCSDRRRPWPCGRFAICTRFAPRGQVARGRRSGRRCHRQAAATVAGEQWMDLVAEAKAERSPEEQARAAVAEQSRSRSRTRTRRQTSIDKKQSYERHLPGHTRTSNRICLSVPGAAAQPDTSQYLAQVVLRLPGVAGVEIWPASESLVILHKGGRPQAMRSSTRCAASNLRLRMSPRGRRSGSPAPSNRCRTHAARFSTPSADQYGCTFRS